MTMQDESATLEAEIERDKASLSTTLDELQDRFSIDRLAEDALGMIRENATSYVGAVDRAVRANPLALAMVAGGIAWLMIGRSRHSDDTKPQSITRWEDEGGSVSLPPHTPHADENADWLRTVDSFRDRALEQLREIREGAANAVGQVRDIAAEKATILAEFSESMKSGFMHGLEDLSDQASERIVAARRKAYAARLRGAKALKKGLAKPGAMIEDHPFVTGSIALAAGAALGAALPRTETEDRLFGEESDRLMQEAARMVAEERDRASKLAGTITGDLKESAKEALNDVTTATMDRVREMAETTANQRVKKS